jgi:hypothetical protein
MSKLCRKCTGLRKTVYNLVRFVVSSPTLSIFPPPTSHVQPLLNPAPVLAKGMNYPYNVPSVTDIHPGLGNNPNILNVEAFRGVNASKAAGSPIDPLAVVEAEDTVEFLSGSKSECVNICPC